MGGSEKELQLFFSVRSRNRNGRNKIAVRRLRQLMVRNRPDAPAHSHIFIMCCWQPVLIVRDPYFWMHSMCESPYLMKWEHTEDDCPNLIKGNGEGNPAQTHWGGFSRKWNSLADVWSEFNREYEQADYPRLIVRFEGKMFFCEVLFDSPFLSHPTVRFK